MRKHVLEKTVGSERGEGRYLARRCNVCAAHKQRSETRYICNFCLLPLHKGDVSRGITPSNTTKVFDEYFLKISVHKNS